MNSILQTNESDYISIRDYFAIQALNGMLSYAWFNPMDDEELTDRITMSYKIADKMLELKNNLSLKKHQV